MLSSLEIELLLNKHPYVNTQGNYYHWITQVLVYAGTGLRRHLDYAGVYATSWYITSGRFYYIGKELSLMTMYKQKYQH